MQIFTTEVTEDTEKSRCVVRLRDVNLSVAEPRT